MDMISQVELHDYSNLSGLPGEAVTTQSPEGI